MALVTEQEARAAAVRAKRIDETAELSLRKSMANVTYSDRFDIFLSHSIRDSEIVLGAKRLLEEAGNTVYVDWIEDPSLDRNNITASTAELLRRRMRQSSALFYLHTESSGSSRWMPWELGYFDGHNGNVAIFPVVASASQTFRGQEYLGLYPYVDLTSLSGSRKAFIHRSSADYSRFETWRHDQDKKRPR